MPFIKPMLACPLPDRFTIEPRTWMADVKIDGHRIIAEVSEGREDLLAESDKTVRAWSREGLSRALPRHVKESIARLPVGIYDGELAAPGERSFGTTRLTSAGHLVFYVFDVLSLLGRDMASCGYWVRREALETMFEYPHIESAEGLELVDSQPVNSMADALVLAQKVWDRDGEGLILKRITAPYRPGKRSKDFIKIKKHATQVFTVVDYLPGELGPCSRVELVDDRGVRTSVKTLNTKERARLESTDCRGWRLRVDYTERTPDGNYREPHWDRWESE